METIARKGSGLGVAVVALGIFLLPGGTAYADCGSPANLIEEENCKAGNPSTEWDVTGAGDENLQGFATDISVNRGGTISFKVNTTATAYHIDIYRLGYYQGNGARLVATIPDASTVKTSQPACLDQMSTTGLVDCGNWSVSASWAVPADAVSGIYIARLQGEAGVTGASHVAFVVRHDGSTSDLLFQTSDTTWQAYNSYGGTSLYWGTGPGTGLSGAGRAYKVSYNRPFNTRQDTPEDWIFNAEYPMVRWLERNGYDVSYTTGVDAARRGSEILNHKVFFSVGHDEYWSGEQRTNVEAARDHTPPVHLAFFSGNEIFWKTRWEASIDGSSTPYRTLVCYKETHTSPPEKIDPSAEWTGTWRDPRFSPPSDGGRPENALSGTIFTVNGIQNDALQVPAADGKMRFWRDTPNVADLTAGQVWTLPAGTLGYEWDEDLDNGARPPGLVRLSTATVNVPGLLQDYGSLYAPGTATHHLAFHRRASGALVFGSGTCQWSWGLDSNHDRGSEPESLDMQQATVNLFADMGAQPVTLQGDVFPASASTDVVAPVSDITSPANGATVSLASLVTIQGTATDPLPGLVGGVEVSTDGGATWHPAVGRASWSYVWTPLTTGSHTILSRAVDDTGNIETPGAGRTVTVTEPPPPASPVSIWSGGGTPTATNQNDGQPLEFGVKFRSSLAGWITHIRFYKGSMDSGTHVGHLWTSTGTLLATATFTGETASGWQEVALSSPVAITANTTYVASCHSSAGYYVTTEGYFAQPAVNWPLTALADGTDGPNGVFKVGVPGFPTDSYFQTNYWVDVVYSYQAPGPDMTPPTVVVTSPSDGASGVLVGANTTATFSEALAPATVNTTTFELRNGSAQLVAATVTWSSSTNSAVLDPTSSLAYSTAYTATVKGGASGVTDVAGNPLAADVSWTFTTQAPAGPPPDQGPGGPILVIASPGNPFSRYYAEILRAEGLNEFAVLDLSAVDASVLSGYDVAILGEMSLSAAQVTMLTTWVNGGGNLIAMRPDKQLASLLGLTDASSTLANAYLMVNTATAPGLGIVSGTMQYHGTADRYTLSGATTVATLYSDASTPTTNPAVTLRTQGSGEAAAFTFDLARSIVYTRQGNPAWAGDERDGVSPMRSDDMFYGAKSGDEQPDWVNLAKVAIPQADEQQRLLANLILKMNADRKPLPRFWYFPRGEKAVVVMTADNHGNQTVEDRFLAEGAASPPGCSVADWECIRSSAYIYTGALPSDPVAKAYENAGFEIGLHVNTDCADWTAGTLPGFYTAQIADFFVAYPSLAPLVTHRVHCVAWSDWATQPKVELANGIRLDTNYYYWPPAWVNDTPGFFTGSGMPMRFADLDGTMIDAYQATTQMTDESGQNYPATIDTLLDRAVGTEGYYGAFVANIHADGSTESQAAAIVISALSRSVPVVSAKQMLTWVDGRNGSSFTDLSWGGGMLTFGIAVGAGANGLEAVVPLQASTGTLGSLTRDGVAVSYTIETIKGIQYAVFRAQPGTHVASYGSPRTLTVTPPTHGTITGTGINCGTGGTDCTEAYGYGAIVDLTANPDTGYALSAWSGACSGTTNPCSVTMDANKTVGATFTIQTFTLTVTPPSNGTITGTGINCGTGGSDCTQTFNYGTAVSLTATPVTGYELSAWSGACSGTTNPCNVTMDANKTVGATFTIQTFTLTVTPPSNGTITGTGISCGTGGSDCTEVYDYGTLVDLAATPDTGYDFTAWSGACSGTTNPCSVTMDADKTVGATFTIQTFTLTVTAPSGGTITGTGITCGTGGSDCTEAYDYGTLVDLAATPDTGYDFTGWSGDCSGTGTCSVTMTADHTVGATFTIQTFTLTVTAPSNGTITGTGISCGTGGSDCTETYNYGTGVSLTAIPVTGYQLSAWSGACSGTTNPCNVTMDADKTVGATFTIQTFTLTVTLPTHGTITGTGITCGTGGTDCAETFDYGTVVDLAATPDANYDFGGWTGDCTGTGSCSVTMTAARTVGATFTIQTFTLTVTSPAHGTITATGINCGTGGSDCTEAYDYGTVVDLTATPDTGYDFGGWSGACAGTGSCSVIMTTARNVGATFTVQRYTLTVTAPAHGKITGTGIDCGTGGSDCSETYDYGTVVDLTATPDTGYELVGWSGDCTGTGACSVTMTAARTVGATFTIQRHTLTVTKPAHGTIAGTGIDCGTGGSDCTETFDYGTVVPLTATPDASYSFRSWSGVCTGRGACSVAMTSAKTVGGAFASAPALQKDGSKTYTGPEFVLNESAAAPRESAPGAGEPAPGAVSGSVQPAPTVEATEPAKAQAPEPNPAPRPDGTARGVEPLRVSVTGEVRNPGTYAWFPGMTVRQLIAAAGGLTPDASARPVLSSRGEMAMDDPVKPGETLLVDRSPM